MKETWRSGICGSVHLSLSLSVSVFPSLCLPPSPSLLLCLSVSVCPSWACLSLYFSVCPCEWLSLCLSVSISLYLLSLPLTISPALLPLSLLPSLPLVQGAILLFSYIFTYLLACIFVAEICNCRGCEDVGVCCRNPILQYTTYRRMNAKWRDSIGHLSATARWPLVARTGLSRSEGHSFSFPSKAFAVPNQFLIEIYRIPFFKYLATEEHSALWSLNMNTENT